MKFLHKLLVFALLFVGVITQASAESFTVNGVVYRITDTGVAVNNLAKDNNLNGIVHVPEEVQYGSTTYKVTGIDYFGNKDIREISLPGTIKKISSQTFMNCKNLQTVKLGEGISYVSGDGINGFGMFQNCTALKNVSLPNSLQYIQAYAFAGCTSLESLQLPEALDSLGDRVFSGCESLSNIELPESLHAIGPLCFYGCKELSTIKVNPANPYFSTDGKAIFNKDKTVLYTSIPLTSYNVPSTVRELKHHAFSNQKDITSITLPEGLVNIGSNAFEGCSKLEHLVIPSTVDSIGMYAFKQCSALQQINIPQGIKYLAEAVLSGTGIKTLDIPSSVNYIGGSAFSNCKSLQSIKLPEGLTLLNYCLFEGCEQLSDIQIPSTVTAIEDCAFNGCKALKTITLPTSLCTFENTWSSNSIFSGCSALKSILVEAGNKYYESDGTALYNKAKDTLVCFPAGVTSYVVPQSVKTIARKAFCGCDSLQNIMFEDGVSDLVIGEYAFENCKNINRLVITSGIKKTEYGAFNDAHINKLVITTSHPRSFYEYYLLRDNTIETIYAPASDLSIIKNLKSSTLIPLDAIYVASDITIGSRSIVFKLVKNEELSGLDELPVNTYPCVKIGNKEIEADENGRYVHAGLAPNREFTYTISAKDSQGENVGSAYSFTKETASLFKSFTLNSGQTYVASSNIRLNVDPEMEQPDECRFVYGYSYTKSCDLKYSDEVQSIKFTGFWPSTTVTLNYQELKDGKVTYSKEYNIMTKDMGLSAEFGKITPTSYTMTGSRNMTYHDAEVVDEGWTLDRETITRHGSTLHVTGCEPESYVNAGYAVMVKNGSETKLYYYSPSKSMQLPALTLETVAEAKATSNTVALICATTNIDDEEANTGFEWRRYDAPDLVPSSKANCPVVDGVMTGALRNLSASTYYKFRPFYKAESGKTWFGEWSAFGTADAYVYFDPTVRTYAAVCHDENSATVSGFIIAGSDDIKEQGFEYWKRDDAYATAKHTTATTDDNTHQTVVATGQRMSAVLQNLEPNTTYIVRAYVTTEHGTTYGEEQIFSTPYSTAIGEVELDEAYSDHLAAKVTKVGNNDLHLAICGTARPVAIRLTAVSGIQMAATTLGSSLESTRHACLHTNRLQPGMYLLHVTDGLDAQTIRIAIK